MNKRLLCCVLAVLLCLGVTPAAAAAGTYSDVPADHWAAESIYRATQMGLFHGDGSGEFGLGRPISRAEFATVLGRFFSWEAVTPSRPAFSDVVPGSWYYAAVETARANNAVDNAYRTFRPDEALTRGDMASMLVRSLGYTYLAAAAADYGCPFSDVTANRGFVIVAYDLGLMGGKEAGVFDPDAPATREQAAAVLVRVHDQLEKPSVQLPSGGLQPVTIATPSAQPGAELPITPLEPLTDLYATLRRMKNNGADMSAAVLRLMAGGVSTLTSNGVIAGSSLLSAREVEELLAREDVKSFYSDQYESAYCFYHPNDYQTVTVWYQSAESMEAKLQLARLFGVTQYVLE